MQDLGARNPAIHQLPEPVPGHLAPLTPPPERAVPAPNDLSPKAVQTSHVAGHCVVVEVTLHNGPQPPPDLANGHVPASSKLLLQLFELGGEAFANGLAPDDEPTSFPGRPTHMGEAQEIECLRLVLAALLPVVGCVAPEFNQARFVRVELQPELPHAVPPVLEKLLGVGAMLEAQHNVIGIPDDNHVARCLMVAPALDPEIEDVVQVDIRQKR